MSISATWYITQITRANSSTTTWAPNASSEREVTVWFGTQSERDAEQPTYDDYDLIFIDNGDGLVESAELRAAFVNAEDASLNEIAPANNPSRLGTSDLQLDADPALEKSVAWSNSNISGATSAHLITTQPITATTFQAAYQPGNGNYEPFRPDTLGVPCFVKGTLISTVDGAKSVEQLEIGTLVMTRDNGLQAIRWVGSRRLSANELVIAPQLLPIRIRVGALGKNTPSTDLLVSPQHRILVRSKIAQRMFGTDEVLVAAKQLLRIDGIDIADNVEEVEYFHFMFDRHEVVYSNGAETESLYTGPQAMKMLGPSALQEIFEIFPELRDRKPEDLPIGARPLVSGRMGRKLATRHLQNGRAIVSA